MSFPRTVRHRARGRPPYAIDQRRYEVLVRSDIAVVGHDTLLSQAQARRRVGQFQADRAQHVRQLGRALIAAVATVGDDQRRLVAPLVIEMVDGVLQRGRIAAIVLRRHEHHTGGVSDTFAPSPRGFVDIVVPGGNAWLVEAEAELANVDHLERGVADLLAQACDPAGDRRRPTRGPYASTDDEIMFWVHGADPNPLLP
jgi:hypothetical protein